MNAANHIREARLSEIKVEMDDLRTVILGHAADPNTRDDFDAREVMWMRREDLREEKLALQVAFKPTWAERISYALFGRFPAPTVGASMIVVCFLHNGHT